MADPTPTWPTPSGRDAVLERVLRGGRRRLMIHRLLIAGAITAGGLAGGVALGATDTVSVLGEATVDVGDGLAGLRPCPGLDPVATLTGGDRVYLTGRSDDGEWLQLRSPFDPADRLWIDAGLVTPDEEVAALPVAGCGDVELTLTLPDGEVVVVTTTTTTTTPEETTTTTEPDETTTTASTVPGQTTTQPPPTTTPHQPTTTTSTSSPPPPPDITPPNVQAPNANPAAIFENHHVGDACPPNSPITSMITVGASDPESGITAVRLSWTLRDDQNNVLRSGNINMVRQGGTWRATLGPFNDDPLPGAASFTGTITMRARATNGQGLQRQSAPSIVTLHDCTFG